MRFSSQMMGSPSVRLISSRKTRPSSVSGCLNEAWNTKAEIASTRMHKSHAALLPGPSSQHTWSSITSRDSASHVKVGRGYAKRCKAAYRTAPSKCTTGCALASRFGGWCGKLDGSRHRPRHLCKGAHEELQDSSH